MGKILVIIDEQNDFTSGVLGNAECEATVPVIVDHLGAEKYDKIILTRDTHYDNYMDTQEGKKLPVPHCIKGTDGWQIREEIMQAVAPYEYSIYDKETFGSLTLGKYLEQTYADNQTEMTFDFVGVCTGICVISNVMLTKAALPEATIRVLEKGCACVTPDSHKTAIEAMKMCHIDII